ncbi:MAG TPA: hypothetical protein VI011_02355 [Asanoa sp.]
MGQIGGGRRPMRPLLCALGGLLVAVLVLGLGAPATRAMSAPSAAAGAMPLESPSPQPTAITPTPTPRPTTSTPGSGPTVPQPSSPSTPTSGRPRPGGARLGIRVTTGDIRLTNTYWTAPATLAGLVVTVVNTGNVTERVTLTYTLPEGVTDAGNAGCAAAGARTVRCGSRVAGAGDRWSVRLRVRVDGDAWRRMPLSGSVVATATGAYRSDLGSMRDNEGFALLFPPGPPGAGIGLAATDVRFTAAGRTATLTVTLTNRSGGPGRGAIEVALPAGMAVATQPPGCVAAGQRSRCDLGSVAAGRSATQAFPITATLDAQRSAPLSGAVLGTLSRAGTLHRVQMSFRILADVAGPSPSAAPAAEGGTAAGTLAPVFRSADSGKSRRTAIAIALVLVSLLLIVLALALATMSVRRWLQERPDAR